MVAELWPGMHDGRVIMLIYWQEEPLGYAAMHIAYTAVNNHKTLTCMGKAIVAAGQAKRCQSISGRVHRSKL